MANGGEGSNRKLIAVTLDAASIGHAAPDVEHERRVAIYDLVEDNMFEPEGGHDGPFKLHIGLVDQKLSLRIKRDASDDVISHLLSLSPFRRILKDYFMVCESYRTAIQTSSPGQIEAIDMGRRGLHDEGADVLVERLKGKIAVDKPTARRLFTLIAALSWKG